MSRRKLVRRVAAGFAVLAMATGATSEPRLERVVAAPAKLEILPSKAHGRVERDYGELVRQWPGSYVEAAFRGSAVMFRVGAGDVALHVLVDGQEVGTLVRPAPGLYRAAGLSSGRHTLRVEVVSESQAGPTRLGPFYAERGTRPDRLPNRGRQIEFIGDSHTVGYGVTSTKRDCTQAEVWATTDTSRTFGALLAQRYRADVQVNAISGRGVVRNYNGSSGDTLPQAYPFALFDRRSRVDRRGWHAQAIVIALGTNDFTTPLQVGEKWATRDTLHADFEATYVRFVQSLRARNPHALIVLWATDLADGEIGREVAKVVSRLRASGEQRLAYVPVPDLSFTGCHSHPSLADQPVIAARIAAAIDAQVAGWAR